MGDDPLPRSSKITGTDDPKSKTSFWLTLGAGAFLLLAGAALGVAALTQYHALATVTHQGPCVTSSSAGLVCTEHVTYFAHDGKTHSAVMTGVHPDEVHGPPSHRTLAITYNSGSWNSPSTDDMPNAVPIGLLAGGIVFLIWASWLWRRAQAPKEQALSERIGRTPPYATAELVRFWFEFERGRARRIGVTAWTKEDAEALVTAKVFHGAPMPIPLAVIEDVDVSQIDPNHVSPKMDSPDVRGIWFPRGYR